MDRFDSEKIVGKYYGTVYRSNRNDSDNNVVFSLVSNVSKIDGYFLLEFDDHPKIHLPSLKLEINEVYKSSYGATYIYVDVMENSGSDSFQCYGNKDDNYFIIAVIKARLDLQIRSTDPDFVYFLDYNTDHSY